MSNLLCFPTSNPISTSSCHNNHPQMTWLVLMVLESMWCLCPSQVKRAPIVLDNMKSHPLIFKMMQILASFLQSPKPIVRKFKKIWHSSSIVVANKRNPLFFHPPSSGVPSKFSVCKWVCAHPLPMIIFGGKCQRVTNTLILSIEVHTTQKTN